MEGAVAGTTGDTAQFSSSQKVTQVCKMKPGSKDLPARTQWAEGAGINLLYFYSGRLANFHFSGFFFFLDFSGFVFAYFLFYFILFFSLEAFQCSLRNAELGKGLDRSTSEL